MPRMVGRTSENALRTPVDACESKTGPLDGGGGVTRQVTVGEDPLPHRLRAMLPAQTAVVVVCGDVLDKHQLPGQLQHSPILLQRSVRVRDRTQHESRHDGVDAVVSHGQVLGGRVAHLHVRMSTGAVGNTRRNVTEIHDQIYPVDTIADAPNF